MFNNSGVTTLEFQVIFIRHRSGTFFRHTKYLVQQRARNVITYPDGRRAYGPWEVKGALTPYFSRQNAYTSQQKPINKATQDQDYAEDTMTEPMKLRRFHL